MDKTTTTGVPHGAKDLDQAVADLNEFGACVVEGARDPKLLQQVRDALYHVAESDLKRGWTENYQYGNDDHINQRI